MTPFRRTSARLVVATAVIGLVFGLLVRPLSARLDTSPPRVGWAAATTLLLVAIIVGMLAWSTWQSLHKKHQRMTSDHAVKMLALSRSSVIVGALFAGGYGGFAVTFLGDLDTRFGEERALHGGAAVVAGILVVVVALLLERACRLPDDHDDDDEGGRTAPDATPA